MNRDRQAALDFDKPRIAQYIAQQPHVEGPTEVDPELASRLKEVIPFPATRAQVMEGASSYPTSWWRAWDATAT